MGKRDEILKKNTRNVSMTRRNVKETRPNGISRYWIRKRKETDRQNVRHCIAINVTVRETI